MVVHPIGHLRQRVILEQPIDSPDGAGGRITLWQPVFETWARVDERSGRELFENDGRKGYRIVEITVRPREAIEPGRRFRMGTRIFNILAVRATTPDRVRQVCTCEERDL